ncbi:flippase [Candidatus Omnitrophota bacterium]
MLRAISCETRGNIIYAMLSTILVAGASIFTRLLVGRFWGASFLGLFSLSVAIMLLAARVGSMGIDVGLTRYLALKYENKDAQAEYAISGLLITFIAGIFAGILTYFLSSSISDFFNIPSLKNVLKTLSFTILPMALNFSIIGIANGIERVRIIFAINCLKYVSTVAALLIVHAAHLPTHYIFYSYMVAEIAAFLYGLGFLRKQGLLKISIVAKKSKSLIRFGLQVMCVCLLVDLNTRLDMFFIGYYGSQTEVGVYSIAILFSKAFLIIPAALLKITTPAIARYHGLNEFKPIGSLVTVAIKSTSLVLTPIAMLLVLLYSDFVSFFFRGQQEFFRSYTPFIILTLSILPLAVMNTFGNIFPSSGRPDLSMKLIAGMILINAVLNYMLVPRYGVVGAATATTISTLMFIVAKVIIIKRVFSYPISYKGFLLLALGGAAFLIGKIGFSFNRPVQLAVIFIIFSAGIFITRLVNKDDIMTLLQVARFR